MLLYNKYIVRCVRVDNYNLIFKIRKNNYTKMFRGPDGLLKHKFIVPGVAYSKSIWDWDILLTNIALRDFVDAARELAEKTLKLFGEHIAKNGQLHEYYNPQSG